MTKRQKKALWLGRNTRSERWTKVNNRFEQSGKTRFPLDYVDYVDYSCNTSREWQAESVQQIISWAVAEVRGNVIGYESFLLPYRCEKKPSIRQAANYHRIPYGFIVRGLRIIPNFETHDEMLFWSRFPLATWRSLLTS